MEENDETKVKFAHEVNTVGDAAESEDKQAEAQADAVEATMKQVADAKDAQRLQNQPSDKVEAKNTEAAAATFENNKMLLDKLNRLTVENARLQNEVTELKLDALELKSTHTLSLMPHEVVVEFSLDIKEHEYANRLNNGWQAEHIEFKGDKLNVVWKREKQLTAADIFPSLSQARPTPADDEDDETLEVETIVPVLGAVAEGALIFPGEASRAAREAAILERSEQVRMAQDRQLYEVGKASFIRYMQGQSA